MRVLAIDSSGLTATVAAVSYTHLDVYKRQHWIYKKAHWKKLP